MPKLFAIPRMRLYFLSNTLSSIGDYALWLAAGIWVKELTGSTSQAGLCMLCLIGGTLLSPLTGVLVDRVRRRPLIMVTNSATGLLVLTLTQVHHASQVWLIFLVMFLYGLAADISGSAMTALLPRMVPEEQLGNANGLTQALTQGQRLITPAIGVGLLAAYGGGAVAIMDAASFAAGVLCWAFIKVEEEKPEPSGVDWRRETTAGFLHLARTPVLRQLTLAMTLSLFVMGFFETLGIAISTEGLHHSASWTGVIVTAMGLTGIVGGVSAGAVMGRIGPGRLTALGLGIAAVAALVMTVRVDAVVIVGALLFGLGLPFVIVGALTAIQLNTPGELLGRVSGADNFLITAGQSIGIATGSGLIAVLPYRDLAYLAAALLALATCYLVTRPEQRQGSAGPTEKEQLPGAEALTVAPGQAQENATA
ncbi:MFS transporter [Streptacidiphilus sp. P02-A3a]|uniref:MFS transporter n=1 Tax=Streptacidiphilus sp. P02-A3a TaxID=2704468 RepID=UPI0015FDA294|nr:MFS transporter [Streptacidiphilus sp. P02-A3a]QMU73192.1 MFS transporter [Streptacidiphilus sp. P02-A3a]